jgi:hypothetical protein
MDYRWRIMRSRLGAYSYSAGPAHFMGSQPSQRYQTPKRRNVRFWPKADIASCTHMSAFGGKADIELVPRAMAYDMKRPVYLGWTQDLKLQC